eukprot:SAG31_NODE_1058_length_10121_cov_14.446617_7_plen_569_part_00
MREALLTYNRYGVVPGPPPPGCSTPQAPCASIAFSMRVNFRENSSEVRCSIPACSAAAGAKLATKYCQSPIYQARKPPGEDCPGGRTNETTHDWVALRSGPGTPSRWRCYSPTALNSNRTEYKPPSRDFCSESATLDDIVKTCKLPPLPRPLPPSPSPPAPPVPVLPFHVVATPPNGSILVKGPSKLPAQFSPLDRQEPVIGSVNGDYKPSIAQLNNSDLLMVFRTHPRTGPLHAVFLRSRNHGRSWTRDDSQTNLLGNEFGLHSLSDGTVLLMDGGNGTAAAIYRSTTWGHSFELSQTIPCKELGWSALEENGTWAPAGVYIYADRTIYRCTTRAEDCVPYQVVSDMSWHDGDTFFGQSTVFRSRSGILRHVPRVGVDEAWDQTDGSQLWHSVDPSGTSWVCSTQAAGGWCNAHSCAPTQHRQCANLTATFGWPGTMYNRFLQLADGRVMITFTQRCNGVGPQPSALACGGDATGDGYGTGLRALVSMDDEGAAFNFSRDYLVLSAQDDNVNPFISGKTAQGCMCGFGGTIQLADSTLLTPYCYTNVTTEMSLIGLVRWALPPEQLR